MKLVFTTTNSFGDQIIHIETKGKLVRYSFPEGEHVNVNEFLNTLLKDAVSLETEGVNALNRIFGA